MNHLTIYRRLFYDSDCYKAGVIQRQRGVQVHSTGANNPWLRRYVQPDDGRLGENPNNNSHNRPGNVCASAYIGKQADGTVAVYQTLPWDMRCWLSGSGKNGNANKLGYAGFEICEDGLENPEYFAAVMEKAILLTAHLCQLFGVTPDTVVKETPDGPALAVMDHQELHALGLASNHGDVKHWMKKFGWTMDIFREKVSDAMAEGVDVTYIDCDEGGSKVDIMKKGSRGSSVKALQELLNKCGYDCGEADGIFGAKTEAAVRHFQRDHALTVDGIVGDATKTALALAAAEDQSAPDTVPFSRTRLKEIRACLALALQDVDNALEGGANG